MTKIIWCARELALLGFCLCVGLCEGANPKCANAGWLKLFFKMCGGKIFKTLRWVRVGKLDWVCVKLQRIVNRVFVARKSGRLVPA